MYRSIRNSHSKHNIRWPDTDPTIRPVSHLSRWNNVLTFIVFLVSSGETSNRKTLIWKTGHYASPGVCNWHDEQYRSFICYVGMKYYRVAGPEGRLFGSKDSPSKSLCAPPFWRCTAELWSPWKPCKRLLFLGWGGTNWMTHTIYCFYGS